MTKNQQSAIGAIFLCFGLVANAETKSNEQWVEYFLDQISGIRVEISRLETDGVVEELRRDQALEERIEHLTKSVEKLTELLHEQRVLIKELQSSKSN
jgi:Ni,Fe-hydrogenase III large subunit